MADEWYDALLKGFDAEPSENAVEPLWSGTSQDGGTVSAVLLYRVEAQILRDGELFIGRLFERKELAVQWAEAERSAMQVTP